MVSFAPFWSQPYSEPSQLQLVGILHEIDNHGEAISIQKIYAHQETLIGRDENRCQHVIHDAVVSNKHLRIYTIIFDDDQSDGIAPLVYAEDLSQNGTYWNGSLIGKGNGGVLLSDGDSLRVSPRIYYRFQQCNTKDDEQPFDLTQECEMKNFDKDYVVSDRKLGSGACGEVFMAIEQSKRRQLACKIVDLRKLKVPARPPIGRLETAVAAEDVDSGAQLAKVQSWAERKQKENRLEQQLKVYYREATILASLSHPNIISIEKVFITDNSIYIFQDLITGGDLFSFLERKNGKLSDVETAVIVRQVLIALEYLHDRNIAHRDLKPENILMTSLANGCRVVLTDFGHAKKIDNDRMRMTTMAGTEQYIAPEIAGISKHFNGKDGYTKAVDMWSLGCVTVVLLTGGSPFVHPSTRQYCQKLAQKCDLQQLENDPEWKLVGKRPKNFVRRLLVLDEEQRMTAKDAKQHSWFSNDFHKVDFEAVYRRATRHWRPSTLKTPVIEVINADQLKELPTQLKSDLVGQGGGRKRSPMPIDPPYRPYPRKMSSSLLPKRRPNASYIMSDEVRTAIQEKWSPEKMKKQTSEAAIDRVPALNPDIGADDPDGPHIKKCLQEAPTTDATSARRAAFTSPFRPLVQKPSSLNQKTVSKGDAAFGGLVVQENLNHGDQSPAVPQPTWIGPNSRTELDRPGKANASADLRDLATDNDTPQPENPATANEVGSSHFKDTDVIAAKSWNITEHTPSGRADQDAGNEDGDVKSGPISLLRTTSPERISNVETAIHPTNPEQTCPGRGGKNTEHFKLHSPTPARLNRVLLPPKGKKRPRSIFDLDDDADGDAEQAQHKLSNLTLETHSMRKPGNVWKKPKIIKRQEAQAGAGKGSRFCMRGGGSISGIADGLRDLYFPR